VRITIVTLERGELLELARELIARGHEVRVWSQMNRTRVEAAGLSWACHRSLPALPACRWLMGARAPESWRQFWDARLQRRADRAAARGLDACDAVIGTAGLCMETFERARHHHGAQVFIECSAHHVLARKKTLEEIPGARRPAIAHFDLKRELQGYAFADVVVCPTQDAARSFVDRGVDQAKIFRNFPGADLDVFQPTSRPELETPTILYVGEWSIRKGCDVLAHAVDGEPWRLIHIGPMGDAPLPDLPRFEQRATRPTSDMRQIYRAAHVIVFPSFDDCVGEPQVRGVASGLPLVCSDRSGGEDLREFIEAPEWVTVVPAGDLMAWRRGLKQGVAMAERQTGVRTLLRKARKQLTWRAHAERYAEELRRRIAGGS
jgi:alpha-maltose-1-phosphate synthase